VAFFLRLFGFFGDFDGAFMALVRAPRSKWLLGLTPDRQTPSTRLFCFPHAGGSAYAYRSWAVRLPQDIELVGVEPPGRSERLREPAYGDARALVEHLLGILSPLLDLPFAIFGHSMGALLAFELSQQLERMGLPRPVHLFVSARPAPHSPVCRTELHRLSDQALWKAACARGGVPELIQGDTSFQRLFLPLFRRDMELVETYVQSRPKPISVPITALGGVDDDHPTIEQLRDWAGYSSTTFSTRTFAGGHFFLRQEEAALVEFVSRVLQPNRGEC
jgi:surfactin synthase thioesterase subunit